MFCANLEEEEDATQRRVKVYCQKKPRRYRPVFAGEHLKTCSDIVQESWTVSRTNACSNVNAEMTKGKNKKWIKMFLSLYICMKMYATRS